MKIKREFKGFAKEKKRHNISSISNNNSNTNVLNCCRSGRYHIKETNLINILEKKINLL